MEIRIDKCWQIVVWVCLVTVAARAQEGMLSGTVQDERLRPIPGALVSIGLMPAPGEKVKPFSRVVATGRNGEYSVSAPPGEYIVCAFVPNSELLSGCVWNTASIKTTIGASKRTTIPAFTLRRGQFVQVTVEDNSKYLQTRNARGLQPDLQIAIRGSGGEHVTMTPKRIGDAEYEFQALVPHDVPLTLRVVSTKLQFADSTGAALDSKAGYQQALRVNGKPESRKVRFRVTGLKPEEKQ